MFREWTPEHVAQFIYAGGKFTVAEWQTLDDETRNVCAAVGQAIEAEKIAAMVSAMSNPMEAMKLAGMARDSAQDEESIVRECLRSLGGRIREERSR